MVSDSPTPPDGFDDTASRIKWLLEQCWGENVSRMAKDLSVSHAALSRVLSGQMPGGRLLQGLVTTKLVDIVWVLTGERTRGYNRLGYSSGDTCPVASGLIPGGRDQFLNLLKPVSFSLATPWLVESAYWWQLTSRNPAPEDAETGMRRGDFLLIETSEQKIAETDDWLGLPIVVRDTAGQAFLAKVDLDLLDDPRFPYGMVVYPERKNAKPKKGREIRSRELHETLLRPDRNRPKAVRVRESSIPIYFRDQIVGIVVQVLRHNPRATVPPAPAAKPAEEAESED